MKIYLTPENSSKEFRKKSRDLRLLINQALYILESFGIPLEKLSSRQLEKMALCFLALGEIKNTSQWSKTRDISDGVSMKSRDIINYINRNKQDAISPGSYDDIRRKSLKLPVMAGIVVHTKPDAAINDSTRGYAIARDYADLIREFGMAGWEQKVKKFISTKPTLAQRLSSVREFNKIPITVNGKPYKLSLGKHNVLQCNIVEEFLPRFGPGAEVLYIGDTAKKQLVNEKNKLKKLNFPELSHGDLPDIVAYLPTENWIFLIEAVYTSGPISKARKLELEDWTKGCKAEIIYVTAFLDRATFRKYVSELAWETEVWIAAEPDHLIHFNGHKFLGPYKSP